MPSRTSSFPSLVLLCGIHSAPLAAHPPSSHLLFCNTSPHTACFATPCPAALSSPLVHTSCFAAPSHLLAHISCFTTPLPAAPTALFLIHTSAPFCGFPPPAPFGINPSSSAPFRPVPPPIHSPPAPAPARHRSSPFIFRLRFRDYSLPPLLHGTTSSQDRIESGEG